MTDKVQKIREEVERLQNELIQEKEKDHGSDIDDACILELQNVLTYIDSLSEEPVNEDLEEAAEKYAYELFPSVGVANTETELAFKAGAKWQKEQMIKQSLPADVNINRYGNKYIATWAGLVEYNNYNIGDKVKVIIIKNE